MSSFEIGDKVKFLNSIGGGVVTKIAGGLVYVQDSTGFDMPMQPNELIRMADQTGVGKAFNQEIEVPVSKPKKGEEYHAPTQYELEEENNRLRIQNANLQDQIKQLKSQILTLQRALARLS